MGLINWFQDCWVMMLRTKPQYLSVLGRKRSSIRSPHKPELNREKNCGIALNFSICLIVMCCSISFGVVLLLLEDVQFTASTLFIPLVIAGICSFTGGRCLAEYITQRTQEVPSIYSCCYQYSSEVLAFFIGWSWLFSQAAIVAAICKVLVLFISHWSENSLLKILENTFSAYADAVPCTMIVLAFTIFVFTGIIESVVWYIVFIPITFVLLVSAVALTHVSNKEKEFSFSGSWLEVSSVDQILTGSSLCVLFFAGPQSILRISQKQIKKNTSLTLGLLNFIGFFFVLLILTTSTQSGKLLNLQVPPQDGVALAANIICIICLCFLGLEAFHPLHFVIEDMSKDGLLFRTFSKKWKPCCFSVASPAVQLLLMKTIILLAILLPLSKLLILSAMFPLIVHTLMPLLVLHQRYRDNTSWQYEPMFQTTARNIRDRLKKKIEESQYTNGIGFDNNDNLELSTTCIDEDSSHSSSDTDIDSVVQQYKDQAKIANMSPLDEHDPSDQYPEPTPSSAFHAKFCIAALFLTSIVNSIALNLADLDNHFVFGVVALVCILFYTVIQGMLLSLPQNKSPSVFCCFKIPTMPWIPGIASLLANCLFTHCLWKIWEIYLGWLILGALIYFFYGLRSSTAANSFYNLRPSHIALHPIPSYGNNCVTQIVPSHQKSLKHKHQKNAKKKILM